MKFEKGFTPWNKGKKGLQTAWNKGSKGIMVSAMKGKKHTPESILKMKQSLKGKTPWNKGKKGVQVSSRKGKPFLKIRGEKHWAWKGGISIHHHSVSEPKYKEWRMLVFTRDSFKCKMCNTKKNLQAHHILRWADFPELRYDVNNGITLCIAHHPRKKKDELALSPYFKELINQ